MWQYDSARGAVILDEVAESEIRTRIEQIVACLKSAGKLVSDGRFAQHDEGSLQDVERVVIKRWRLPHIRDRYAGDLNRFAEDIVTIHDKYALELVRLLNPYTQEKPTDCELYRGALYFINTIRGLRRYLEPEDALQQTWVVVMGNQLKILGFMETASLKTWVQKILRNEILQVARRRGLIKQH